MTNDFELTFDPRTIEHLGVKMYSTLPPALAELISNAYDADASKISIQFHEQNNRPLSIVVRDDGLGMSSEDIQEKFLMIGRNRRDKDGDFPSPRFKRLPTGKKGLGKLALFGLAEKITVDTVKSNLRNRFILDWQSLLNAEGKYNPTSELRDEKSDKSNGTIITLSNLKRKSSFDLESLADSLSRIFIVDKNFSIKLNSTSGDQVQVTNERKYAQINTEFEWGKNNIDADDGDFYAEIDFRLITSKTPIPPSSGLRGITIFSRGKLVNNPEFFSNSTSSHFFQYLTGWISADFIDLFDEDVISTNRQSINWEHPQAAKFREYLSSLISKVNSSWRDKRKEHKDTSFTKSTGIDRADWLSKLPPDVRQATQSIVDRLSDDEGVSESFIPVIESLHTLVPEYPLLHWRHLHESIRTRIESYYQNGQFGEAADQGTKIFAKLIRDISGSNFDGTDLAKVFGPNNKQQLSPPPLVEVADRSTDSGFNMQLGQDHLTRGVMHGFRNPISHDPIDQMVPNVFSEVDCLNILSLISYLTTRLDNAKINKP